MKNADTALRLSLRLNLHALKSVGHHRSAPLTCTTRWSQLSWRESLPRAARNPRDSPYSISRSSLWTCCCCCRGSAATDTHREHHSVNHQSVDPERVGARAWGSHVIRHRRASVRIPARHAEVRDSKRRVNHICSDTNIQRACRYCTQSRYLSFC